jgi:hypothetical protein
MTPAHDQLCFADILTLAERESGAYGLADEGTKARLEAIVDWINERGPYTADQGRGMQSQLRNLLARRLKVRLDRDRFPAIAQEKIERPVFIIGFARSGTTLLHSLLAEHPDVLAPQSWHMYAPSPPPGAGPVVRERIAYAQRQIEAWMDFCPAQKPMHPYVDKGAYQLIEDEEVFTLDFHATYPYHFYKVPTLDTSLMYVADPAAAFRFHREMLQHLQWNTGKTRWVCKGPMAQMHLGALFEVYPDALCIWAHRPVAEIYASITTLSTVIYDTINGKPTDLATSARPLAEGMKAGFDQLMASSLIDDPRILHIPFREFAADPVAGAVRICERAGLPPTSEFKAHAQAWLANPENQIDRFGRYPYSYEALGLEQEWLEDLFADYSKRFGLD